MENQRIKRSLKKLAISNKVFIFILLLGACKRNNKIECSTNSKTGNEICWAQDSIYRIEKNGKDGEILEIYTNDKKSRFKFIEFNQNDNTLIKKVLLKNPDLNFETTIFFDSVGKINKITREDFTNNELINYEVENWGVKITAYSVLKENNHFLRTSELSITNEGDTISYFYYKKKSYGFEILTNLNGFNTKRNDIDSLEITYTTEELDNMVFKQMDNIIYVPSYGNRKQMRILNSYLITTKAKEIKGEMWGYFSSTPPYSYYPLVLKGDFSARLSQFIIDTKDLKNKYNGKLEENKEIVNYIISTNVFELENGRVVFSN